MPSTAELYPELTIRERIVIAAEREIALTGIHRFRKKAVIEDAGSLNISLLNYHYPDLDKLIVNAIFYRAKAQARYCELMLEEISVLEESGESVGLEHWIAAQVAPYHYMIRHTLPAPYFCSASESLANSEAELHAMALAQGYDWIAPKRECSLRAYMAATQLLGSAAARARTDLGFYMLISGVSEIEFWLRTQEVANGEGVVMDLKISRRDTITNLCAFIMRDKFRGVPSSVNNIMERVDAKAGHPSWFFT